MGELFHRTVRQTCVSRTRPYCSTDGIFPTNLVISNGVGLRSSNQPCPFVALISPTHTQPQYNLITVHVKRGIVQRKVVAMPGFLTHCVARITDNIYHLTKPIVGLPFHIRFAILIICEKDFSHGIPHCESFAGQCMRQYFVPVVVLLFCGLREICHSQ